MVEKPITTGKSFCWKTMCYIRSARSNCSTIGGHDQKSRCGKIMFSKRLVWASMLKSCIYNWYSVSKIQPVCNAVFIDTFLWSANLTFKYCRSQTGFYVVKQELKNCIMELLNQQKRILVLDKNDRILSVVDEISCYGDYNIQTIYDPNSVYDQAKSFKPDLIILNYVLLDGGCALICGDFKEDDELKSVPIIIVTAYGTRKANADFYRCDALFIKPLDMEVLASRMSYLLASWREELFNKI